MIKKMRKYYFIIVIFFLFLIGCSSGKSTPVIPENPQADINLPANELNTSESLHSILGAWTLSINHETLEATVTPNRSLERHYNVKYLIPIPEVSINTIYPNYVIDADVTLTNPYTFPAYDVRLIIFTDEYGHFLDNADVWTDLYDIPVGQDINPFKAYAKDQPNRIFEGETQHTENLLVFNPPPGHPIQFAIDASYPCNCEEPYAFENFQQDVLHPHVGANAAVTIDVLDWQNDVSEVYLQCPEITNEPETPFEFVASNSWSLNLVNNTGAPVGEYNAIIYAKSSGSGNLELIDKIKIRISTIGIPLSPVNVGEYRTPLASCKDVCIHNGYLFALDSYYGLYVLDISNPSEPDIISNLPLELAGFYNSKCRLDCSGNYALAGPSPNNGGIYTYYVVDVSTPRHMEVVGSIELNYEMVDISYDGNYAVLGADSALLVLDLSTPGNPFVAGTLEIPSEYPVLQGNYVYTDSQRDYQNIMSVVDISDPGNPVVVSEYDVMGDFFSSNSVALDGNILCVASNTRPEPDLSCYLETVDISDPHNPVRLDYIEFTGYAFEEPGDEFRSVTISGGYVLLTWEYWISWDLSVCKIQLLDISNPGYIQEKGYCVQSFLNGAIDGNFCYVDNFGLGIIDFNDPDNLQYKRGFYGLDATELKITDTDLAYVANSFYNLCVFDVNNPQNPQKLSDYNLQYYNIRALDSFNDYVFLSLYEPSWYSPVPDRILVLDASDPYSLSETTFLDVDYPIYDLNCNGEYLFVASDWGLVIFDVSNPQILGLTGSIATEMLNKITQQDNYVYAVKWGSYGKFIVFDISDPSNPWIASETDCYCPYDLEVKDNLAFLLGKGYLKIYDISTPANPVEITEFEPLDDSNYRLTVSGNFIYLGRTGEIWDITDLQNPQYLSQLDIPQQTLLRSYDYEIVDNYAFLSCGGFGLQVNKLW